MTKYMVKASSPRHVDYYSSDYNYRRQAYGEKVNDVALNLEKIKKYGFKTYEGAERSIKRYPWRDDHTFEILSFDFDD